jgi:hypothetical protein
MPTIGRGFTVIGELRQISNHCPPGLASRARLTGSSFCGQLSGGVPPKDGLRPKGQKDDSLGDPQSVQQLTGDLFAR